MKANKVLLNASNIDSLESYGSSLGFKALVCSTQLTLKDIFDI